MEVSELQKQLSGIELKRNTKYRLLKVIDLKVNDGIKDVLIKLDDMERRFEKRFENIDKQFVMTRWMIGILAAIMIAALFKN